MYFILFVVIFYITWWISNNAQAITDDLTKRGYIRTYIIHGYVASAVKGLCVGYTIWFIYYCISNYPYDLF